MILLQNEFKIECDLSEYTNEEKLIKKCVNSVIKGSLNILNQQTLNIN